MPFLDLTSLTLSGKISIEAKIAGPEYIVAELSRTTSTAKAFGYNISSDDTQIIVGAYSSSKAFIYEFDGTNWNKTGEFTKTGRFGFKVAIDGEWAAVANTPTSGNGSVFIYRKVGGVWQTTEHTTLNNPDIGLGNGFAGSISINNGTLAVGHTKANSVGGAHIYVWSGTAWTKQGNLLTVATNQTRSGTNQNLGIEIAVHGDNLVVGGSGDTLGKGNGVAFVSKRTGSTWSAPILIKPETTYLDGYGWAVRVRGNSILVAAPYGNAADAHPGRVFLYDFSGASPNLQKIFTVKTDRTELIQDPLMKTTDSFGWSIDINPTGDVIAVGSVNRNGNRGIAYIYEKNNNVWGVSATPNSWIEASNASANHRFGSAVAFAQDGLVVGAFGLGAFYWFK
ncbi:hypothetical protein D3C87_1033060 [compost metagenome]